MTAPDLDREETVGYQARVAENYRHNYPYGIAQGLFFYAGLGLYNASSIFSKLIFDLSGSNRIVGLMGTVMNLGFASSQMIGMALIEHLREKKRPMLIYGVFYRLPWFLMALALLLLPSHLALVAIIGLYALGHFAYGIYLLAFFDLMANIIPLKQRGDYFGRRNSLSIGAQAAAGGLAGLLVGRFSYLGGAEYRSPYGYALCLVLAFGVHLIDLWLLARMKEEPMPTTGVKATVWAKIKAVPALLRTDLNFARYCVLRSLLQLGFYGSSFFIIYASQRIEITGSRLGVFTAVNLTAWAFGTYVWGRFADRLGFKRIMEVCTVLLTFTYFASPLLNSYLAFIIFFAASGFCSGGQVLSFDTLQMEFGKPENRPTYIATTTFVAGVAGILGPILAGIIADRYSYVVLFYIVGGLMLVAAVATYLKVIDPRRMPEYRAKKIWPVTGVAQRRNGHSPRPVKAGFPSKLPFTEREMGLSIRTAPFLFDY
ncbi:MAG: MFS transporter [bacterium]